MPVSLQQPCLIVCHVESGHQAKTKTAERFSSHFYFPGWRKEAAAVNSECPECARYCRGTLPKQGEMQLMEVEKSTDGLSVELVKLNPTTARWYTYILTGRDKLIMRLEGLSCS